jgi:hypothetical protein
VQGRLTDRLTQATIDTVCAHCDEPIRLTIDSEMRYEIERAGSKPMFFEPQIDWPRFREPNIIHAY